MTPGFKVTRSFNVTRRLPIAVVASLCVVTCLDVARAESLEDVVTRMDNAAKQFKSYTATVKRIDHDSLLNENDETDGTFRLKRGKSGIVGIMDFTSGADHYIIHLNGSTVEKYLPNAAMVQVFNARQSAGTIDQMLLLGFSVTREELDRDYTIKLLGTETIGSTATTHIQFTPKGADVLKYVKTIELWIPEGKGNPIRQKGTEPGGNYKVATFSNLQVNPNPPLPDSAFELALPPGVKRVKGN